MTDLALAAAQILADDVDAWGMPVLRALLPVAGMTVIEQQAERARALGLAHMLLLVDTVPPALTEACDRIRGRGLSLTLVRGADDVRGQLGEADRLLLVADGLLAGDAAWRSAMNDAGSSMLVTADSPMTQSLERVDAAARWAGLALLDRAMFVALDDAPQDWDPQLLLFRHAVQHDAARITCDPSLFISGAMVLADTPEEAGEAGQQLLAAQCSGENGVAARWVIGPVLRLGSQWLLRRQDSGVFMRALTILMAIGAAIGALIGNIWVAAGLGIGAAIAHQAAAFIASFRPESASWQRVGGAGLAMQFSALALAERESRFGTVAQWLGSDAMPLTLVILLSWAIARRVGTGQGRFPDLALAWSMIVLLGPLLGWSVAFANASVVAALLVLAALLIGERTVKTDAV